MDWLESNKSTIATAAVNSAMGITIFSLLRYCTQGAPFQRQKNGKENKRRPAPIHPPNTHPIPSRTTPHIASAKKTPEDQVDKLDSTPLGQYAPRYGSFIDDFAQRKLDDDDDDNDCCYGGGGEKTPS